MRRSLIFLLFFQFSGFFVLADCQTTVTYTYNDAGNRITQEIIEMGCMKEPPDTTEDKQEHFAEEEHPEVTATTEGQLANNSNEDEPLSTQSGPHQFNLYPNPTEGKVVIEAEQEFLERNNARVKVFDLRGREIVSKPIDDWYFVLDLSDQADGAYLVRLLAENYEHEVKVVKQ